jgi:predicted nucleotidyltransferase
MDTSLSVPTIDKRQRISMEVIHVLVSRIAEQFHPHKIILFGSYAYGNPRPESDVDLLFIMDTPLKESQQSLQIRRYLNILFGMDLLIYTPQRLSERLEWGDSFLQEIISKGVVLYEEPHPAY